MHSQKPAGSACTELLLRQSPVFSPVERKQSLPHSSLWKGLASFPFVLHLVLTTFVRGMKLGFLFHSPHSATASQHLIFNPDTTHSTSHILLHSEDSRLMCTCCSWALAHYMPIYIYTHAHLHNHNTCLHTHRACFHTEYK